MRSIAAWHGIAYDPAVGTLLTANHALHTELRASPLVATERKQRSGHVRNERLSSFFRCCNCGRPQSVRVQTFCNTTDVANFTCVQDIYYNIKRFHTNPMVRPTELVASVAVSLGSIKSSGVGHNGSRWLCRDSRAGSSQCVRVDLWSSCIFDVPVYGDRLISDLLCCVVLPMGRVLSSLVYIAAATLLTEATRTNSALTMLLRT